ncbi:hypothetical protein EAV90_00165 [Bradyrhizobium vignae]|nr:hypothetical protein EAV90_00165 [Bradyrhizobium vignae]
MRSIEPGISRFRVRLCQPPRNDGLGPAIAIFHYCRQCSELLLFPTRSVVESLETSSTPGSLP